MSKFVTTLNEIQHYYSKYGQDVITEDMWINLMKHLDKTETDDEPLSLSTIFEVNGFIGMLRMWGAVKNCDREFRLFACSYARKLLPFFEQAFPYPGPRQSVEIAEMYANGLATKDELNSAGMMMIRLQMDMMPNFSMRKWTCIGKILEHSLSYCGIKQPAAWAKRRANFWGTIDHAMFAVDWAVDNLKWSSSVVQYGVTAEDLDQIFTDMINMRGVFAEVQKTAE